MVLQWDVSDGTIAESRMVAPPIVLVSAFGANEKPPRVRSLDYWAETGSILVGTNTCDVLEVTAGVQVRTRAVFLMA